MWKTIFFLNETITEFKRGNVFLLELLTTHGHLKWDKGLQLDLSFL